MRKWGIRKKRTGEKGNSLDDNIKNISQNPVQPKGNYAFIDSQNLNIGTQKFGWKLDWAKFREHLSRHYNVTHAYLFIGYMPEFETMYEQLHDQGYLIVLKPTFDMTRVRASEVTEAVTANPEKPNGTKIGPNDSSDKTDDKKPTKGNVDADLVLWAMKEIPNYGRAVIVSGDGDFYSLVEYLDEQKKLLKLVAPNAHYSKLFSKYENYIDRLDLHKKQLAYYSRRRRAPTAEKPKGPSTNIKNRPRKKT